jgi:hypothetical protein
VRTATTSLFQLAARFMPALCASESTVEIGPFHSLRIGGGVNERHAILRQLTLWAHRWRTSQLRGDYRSINEGEAMKKQARYQINPKRSESDGAPDSPAGAISGEFVTETFEYEGGRQVTVYVPAEGPEAIVFAGDGQGISKWGRLLEKGDVASTMIVGVHGLADEMLRLHEYSLGFEPKRFAAHEMSPVRIAR